ncbi:MAG: HDOD domain-containing protein [Natronospirillum sp.]
MMSKASDPALGKPSMASAHIALQPLCDREYRHRADALLYRHSVGAEHAEIVSPTHATASAVILAVYEIGLAQLVGERDLYVKAPSAWLKDPDLLPPPDPKLVLEVNHSDLTDDLPLPWLIKSGYRLSLFCEDWPNSDSWPSFETIKIAADNVKAGETRLTLLRALNPEIGFIAHRVADRAMFELCHRAGFDRFQGYFYAQPMTLKSGSRQGGGNRQVLLRMMQELHQEQPDMQRLSSWLTQLPEATYLLLKRVNSASGSSVRKIESLSEALVRLGLTDLKTLIASLLITDMGHRARLLLPDVLTRAAFCRRLADRNPELDADTAFSVGLFSVLPLILGLSLHTMLIDLKVSRDIELALRSRGGGYGKLLRLVEAYDAAGLSQQNRTLIASLNQHYLKARAWTQELLASI